MLIGNQYADNKLYRGIEHFDKNPLTSGDIHEYTDTAYMKNSYIMNNILGYGTLNSPSIIESDEGLYLSDPSVVMIDGDIALIQSDENSPFISKEKMRQAGYRECAVCILGWYQYLSVSSTLRNYGGVDNSILENDLSNPIFGRQISGRHQFRWFPVVLDKVSLSKDNITLTINNRDRAGEVLNTTTSISSINKKNDVFVFNAPSSMDYARSELYLVPILEYLYDSTLDKISFYSASTRLQSYSLLVEEEEPKGNFSNGTQWYNPITREFKTYVKESGGFVSTASKMAFLQYQSVHTIVSDIEVPQNIDIPVNISELSSNDILQVVYEGIVLVVGDHFTVDYENNTITLLDFTVKEGDHIYFTVTKIVEANDITNVTSTVVTHMDTTASSTVEGHLKLSDTLSDSDATKGIAATPKLVKDTKEELSRTIEESKLIRDDENNVSYRFGVQDGLLYIEEVSNDG